MILRLYRLSDFPHSWESEFSPWTQDEEMCSPLVCACKLLIWIQAHCITVSIPVCCKSEAACKQAGAAKSAEAKKLLYHTFNSLNDIQ